MTADIAVLYDRAMDLYYEYIHERAGETHGEGDVRYHAVSPRKVRAAAKAWEESIDALRAAGGTPDVVRAMLQERGAAGAAQRRKA